MLTGSVFLFLKEKYKEGILERVGVPTLATLFYSFATSISNLKVCYKIRKHCIDAPIHDILLIYIAKETGRPIKAIDEFLVLNSKMVEEEKTTFRLSNEEILEEAFDKLKPFIFENLNYFYEEKNIDEIVLSNLRKKFQNDIKKLEFLLNTSLVFYLYLLKMKNIHI